VFPVYIGLRLHPLASEPQFGNLSSFVSSILPCHLSALFFRFLSLMKLHSFLPQMFQFSLYIIF
jgi:hypothetical protein